MLPSATTGTAAGVVAPPLQVSSMLRSRVSDPYSSSILRPSHIIRKSTRRDHHRIMLSSCGWLTDIHPFGAVDSRFGGLAELVLEWSWS